MLPWDCCQLSHWSQVVLRLLSVHMVLTLFAATDIMLSTHYVLLTAQPACGIHPPTLFLNSKASALYSSPESLCPAVVMLLAGSWWSGVECVVPKPCMC